MKIILYGNKLNNYYDFLNKISNNINIVGILFDVLMTNYGKIIISSTSNNNFQKNNLLLDDMLKYLTSSNKKIIINLLPVSNSLITQYNYQNIIKMNEQYIKLLKNILDKYPMLEFYISSFNENILYFIKSILYEYKNGLILTKSNINYSDVDFYIFNINMIDEKIISQQLYLNKEIMILLPNSKAVDIILRLVSNNKEILNKIYFINN